MRYLLLLLLLPSLAFADDDDDYEAARQMRKQMQDAQDERDMQVQQMQNTLDDMAAAQKKEYKRREMADMQADTDRWLAEKAAKHHAHEVYMGREDD